MAQVVVDTGQLKELGAFVRAVYSDQLPFALSRAINWTALDAQKKMRERQRRLFDITRPTWVDRAVRLYPFAQKKDYWTPEGVGARLMVAPPGGKRRRDVIGKFEDDDTKEPFRSRFLWVPVGAPKKNPKWRPKALRLRKKRRSSRSRVGGGGGRARQADILEGERNTFAIIRSVGSGRPSYIFERETGDDLNLLWISKSSVPLPPDLEFVDTIRREALRVWGHHFDRSFTQALQTARTASFLPGSGALTGPIFRQVSGSAPWSIPSLGGIGGQGSLRRPLQGGQSGTASSSRIGGLGARDRKWNPL